MFIILTAHAHAHRHLSIYFTKHSAALNVQSKAFSCVGVKIWNGIPTRLKNVTKLIEILETENSYADIDTLK